MAEWIYGRHAVLEYRTAVEVTGGLVNVVREFTIGERVAEAVVEMLAQRPRQFELDALRPCGVAIDRGEEAPVRGRRVVLAQDHAVAAGAAFQEGRCAFFRGSAGERCHGPVVRNRAY